MQLQAMMLANSAPLSLPQLRSLARPGLKVPHVPLGHPPGLEIPQPDTAQASAQKITARDLGHGKHCKLFANRLGPCCRAETCRRNVATRVVKKVEGAILRPSEACRLSTSNTVGMQPT